MRISSPDTVLATILAALLLATVPTSARSQERTPHLGIGIDATLGPPGNRVIGSAFGMGFRARVSYPVSYDVSLAAGMGVNGSFLRGWDETEVTLAPQASVIVTLPNEPWAPYVLAGVGGYIPTRSIAEGGPSIHGGIGWARLLTDASIYLEINPQLVIGETTSRVVLPLRAGVIF